MPDTTMKILHVTPCIYPATRWGGPAYSVHALCNGLAARDDVDLRVIANDAAGPERNDRLIDSPELQRHYPGYRVQLSHRLIGHAIAADIFPLLWREAADADVIHATATYNFTTLAAFIVARLRGKPLMWSPRGALQASAEWSESTQPLGKRLWERALRIIAPARTMMHVTAEAERQPSQARMPGFGAVVIPNGIDLPATTTPIPPIEGRQVRLMFLSRVHPKKGTGLLIEALARLGAGYRLDIYGTGESAYLAELAELAARLNIADRIAFHGHVDGAAKDAAYAAADMMVLPTHSENFGLVIAEALAAGRPVVTTKQAPWAGLETHDCGRWVDNDLDAVVAAVREVAAADMDAMGQRGRAWMASDFGWDGIATQMAAAYRRLVTTS
ncbi:MAG: glycosyltransferase [Sphingopyxis sp.]|uniref:glycosyltransferase n=1 Tax=Sphingopyxis sp. TaxID=1908224 RepID=UPI003D80C701